MIVLVVNSGSSSLKYQLFETEGEEQLAKGLVERIGDPEGKGRLKHETAGHEQRISEAPVADHVQAVKLAFEALTDARDGAISSIGEIEAVGHRVVHGGERFAGSVMIDDDVIDAIEQTSALAPLHNPPNLMGIRACMKAMDVPQVAVFDTAFHSKIPASAHLYAIPYEMYKELGIRRYGFHGTSHKYVSMRAAKMLDRMGRPHANMVTCHLGNGCSATAVKDGVAVDTSMGMTPAEGLVMGTRGGDLDPAILPFLSKKYGWTLEDQENLINKKGGVLGLSGISNDMRDIETQAEEGHQRAKLALDVFCYRLRKYIGSYAAAMGGLDVIVFTGGIGENSPIVRQASLKGLEFLGVVLDEALNEVRSGERLINADGGKVSVLVIPTNEELMIARETAEIATPARVV